MSNFEKTFSIGKNMFNGLDIDTSFIKSMMMEPGLNDMKPADVALRLEVLEDFLRCSGVHRPDAEKPKLRVFYAFAKITPKIVRKPCIVILYENGWSTRNDFSINKRFKVIHTRFQTEKEIEDGQYINRMYTEFRYFINEAPWNGDIDAILHDNFEADKNNVSEIERQIIRQKLISEVQGFYGNKLKNQIQLRIQF